ncbi:MAG: hypothetical protein Q9170_000415 [Blastenia crenularia]
MIGVDLEEAGEKWRAGDSQKSARFFLRALGDYEAGLEQFPKSFDLAYNKARLQYGLAQQPRLLQHLPAASVDLLQTALDSHRYALELNQANADLLFNTGQVLTSLAELISESRYKSDQAPLVDPLHLFQEALEFFQRCLGLQEYQFTQPEADGNASAQDSMDVDETARDILKENASGSTQSNGDRADEDTWAIIFEPVTHSTLLDTLLAQVETLTSLSGLLSVRRVGDPSWIEQYFQDVLQEKTTVATKESERQEEVGLIRAKFRCALADAGFSTTRIELLTYEREIIAAFEEIDPSGNNPQALCDRADAELVFNANLYKSLEGKSGTLLENSHKINVIRWKHLTRALDSLTAASKLPDAKNLARIHLRRGDCELLRRRLGSAPSNYDIASKSEPTLLKNAETYYRGASRSAKAESTTNEEGEASIKEAVVAVLSGDQSKFGRMTASNRAKMQEMIEEMMEEGLLSEHDLENPGIDSLHNSP